MRQRSSLGVFAAFALLAACFFVAQLALVAFVDQPTQQNGNVGTDTRTPRAFAAPKYSWDVLAPAETDAASPLVLWQETSKLSCLPGAFAVDAKATSWNVDPRANQGVFDRALTTCEGDGCLDADVMGRELLLALRRRATVAKPSRLILLGDQILLQLGFALDCLWGAELVEFGWKQFRLVEGERKRPKMEFAEWRYGKGASQIIVQYVPLYRGGKELPWPPRPEGKATFDTVVVSVGAAFLPGEVKLFRSYVENILQSAMSWTEQGGQTGTGPLIFLEPAATHFVSEGGEYDHRFSFDLGLSRTAFHMLMDMKECLPREPSFSHKEGGVFHQWRSRITFAAAEKVGFHVIPLNTTVSASAARQRSLLFIPFYDFTALATVLHPQTENGCLPMRMVYVKGLWEPVVAGIRQGLLVHPRDSKALRGETPFQGFRSPMGEALQTMPNGHSREIERLIRLMSIKTSDVRPAWDDQTVLMSTIEAATATAQSACSDNSSWWEASKMNSSNVNNPAGVAMCTTFRNEAFNILEWVAFHKMQGVEKVYACDDSSIDYSVALLQPYLRTGFVELLGQTAMHAQHSGNKHKVGRSVQMICISRCMERARANPTIQWVAMVDVDEFMFPDTASHPNQTLRELLQQHIEHPCFRVPRISFGAFPHFHRPTLLTIQAYKYRSSNSSSEDPGAQFRRNRWPKLVVNVNYFKGDALPKPAIHNPVEKDLKEKCAGVDTNSGTSDLRINHYTRSLEDWMLKVQTYNPTIGGEKPRSVDQFLARQWEEETDDSAWSRYGCGVAAELRSILSSL